MNPSALTFGSIAKSSRRLILDITLREIAQLTATGRLRFDRDVETWLEDALLANGIEVVPIDASRPTSTATLSIS